MIQDLRLYRAVYFYVRNREIDRNGWNLCDPQNFFHAGNNFSEHWINAFVVRAVTQREEELAACQSRVAVPPMQTQPGWESSGVTSGFKANSFGIRYCISLWPNAV